jgi:hypothetical protein
MLNVWLVLVNLTQLSRAMLGGDDIANDGWHGDQRETERGLVRRIGNRVGLDGDGAGAPQETQPAEGDEAYLRQEEPDEPDVRALDLRDTTKRQVTSRPTRGCAQRGYQGTGAEATEAAGWRSWKRPFGPYVEGIPYLGHGFRL